MRTIVLCCYGATATIEKEIFIVARRKALGDFLFIYFLSLSFWRVIND